MNGKSCFFIGHRETSEAIYPALYAVVEQHILEYGVTEFIVGHYGGFDSTFYPPGMESVPRKVAIVRANRYVVDHVDYLIAYAWHPASNARELVEYAKRRVKKGSLFITVIKHNDST